MGRASLAKLAALACMLVLLTAAESTSVVDHAVDGDTLRLTDGTRIRLIGINSPEYEPWRAFVQPYGKEASAYLHQLLDGKRVRLEYDAERKDRYGRTLAYVYLPDGRFVNQMIIDEGLARTMYVAPNGKYYEALKKAQKTAKEKHKGLWS